MPMGLAISSDRFNRLVEEAMKKEPKLKFRKIMDDVLLFAETFQELRDVKIVPSGVQGAQSDLGPKKISIGWPWPVSYFRWGGDGE